MIIQERPEWHLELHFLFNFLHLHLPDWQLFRQSHFTKPGPPSTLEFVAAVRTDRFAVLGISSIDKKLDLHF